MAENKQSFLLYCDQRGLFDKLPDEMAGRLIKHIFAYVNDEHPKTDELLLEVAFEPIKTNLKRDLKRWKSSKSDRSKGAAIANLKRWHPNLYKRYESKELTLEQCWKIAGIADDESESLDVAPVGVNVNVNVNENVNVKDKKSKPKKDQPELPFSGDRFLKKWKDWKAHRKAFDKFKYTAQSERAALTKLKKLAKTEVRAIAMIDQSIERGWKGFFPLKQEEEPKTNVLPKPEEVLKVFPGSFKIGKE